MVGGPRNGLGRRHPRPPGAPALLLLLAACLDPAALVPATVVDDPSLPSVTIEVAGVSRRLHLREQGDPDAPTLLVVPGVASDVRAYAALEALADAYHVVRVDLRGNGLSERVPREELDFGTIPEELDALRAEVAGDRPVFVLGHSWSAAMAVTYAARHPASVAGLVLIEPPALTPEAQADVPLDVDLLSPEYLELAWAATQLGPVDHPRLDFLTLGILRGGVASYLCDPDDPPDWPVWRPGGLALLAWQDQVLDGLHFHYDFAAGIEAYDGPVLLVASGCSSIGRDFQLAVNAPLFADVEVLTVEDAGHRLPVEAPEALVDGVRAWMDAHR